MDFKEAIEILKVFSNKVLERNQITKITEFGIPYLTSDGFKPRYRKADFFINNNGQVYEYKLYSGVNVRIWLKFQYKDESDLSEIQQFTTDRKFGDKWVSLKNNEDIDEAYENDVEGGKMYSSYYLNGGIKTQKIIDPNGQIVSYKEYKNNVVTRLVQYNKVNKIVSDYRFDAKGKPTTKRENEYDSNENLIRHIYTSKAGEITTDLRMIYDKNNNLIESVDIPKKVYSELFNVDLDKLAEQGNEIESYRHKYSYNSLDLLVKHQIFLACQYGIGYEYEYLMES